MATKQSRPKQATQLLQALREAVNDYGLARANHGKRENLERLKTNMIDARGALRDFLNGILAETPPCDISQKKRMKMMLMSKDIRWSSKEMMRYRALNMAVDEQIKEDEEGHKSKFWELVEQNTSPESEPLPNKQRKEQPPTKPDAEEDDWVFVEAEDLANEEFVDVLRIHALPEYWKLQDGGI